MSQSQLCGEIGGTVTFYSADTFVRKVYGDAEARFFYEEALYFIQCPGMAGCWPYIGIIRWGKSPLLETVQVFVDGTDAVFPKHLFPFGGGEVVL